MVAISITGCASNEHTSSQSTPNTITVSSNNSKDVEKILSEESSTRATNSYTNSTYTKEKGMYFSSSDSLEVNLQKHSWNNGSLILTFNEDGSIIAHAFHGNKLNLVSDDYGSYSVTNNTLNLNINKIENNPNIISNYILTVTEKTINKIFLEGESFGRIEKLTLICVEKL